MASFGSSIQRSVSNGFAAAICLKRHYVVTSSDNPIRNIDTASPLQTATEI